MKYLMDKNTSNLKTFKISLIELMALCRTRKKYLKNSMSKNKMTFNF
jgi:hypothetical protein